MSLRHIDFTIGHESTTQAAEYYLLHGITPGGFMEAVICGDLFGAASRADHQNRSDLANITNDVYMNFPSGSFGSRENYYSWLNDEYGQRTAYKEKMEKLYTARTLATPAKEI